MLKLTAHPRRSRSIVGIIPVRATANRIGEEVGRCTFNQRWVYEDLRGGNPRLETEVLVRDNVIESLDGLLQQGAGIDVRSREVHSRTLIR